MIVSLNRQEMASLTLHMNIMRKNVRKGFKSNYGHESKAVLESYDEVKKSIADELEKLGDQDGTSILNYNIREVNMLSSFLDYYLEQLNKEFKDKKLSDEDQQQIDCMIDVKKQIDELKAQ